MKVSQNAGSPHFQANILRTVLFNKIVNLAQEHVRIHRIWHYKKGDYICSYLECKPITPEVQTKLYYINEIRARRF